MTNANIISRLSTHKICKCVPIIQISIESKSLHKIAIRQLREINLKKVEKLLLDIDKFDAINSLCFVRDYRESISRIRCDNLRLCASERNLVQEYKLKICFLEINLTSSP